MPGSSWSPKTARSTEILSYSSSIQPKSFCSIFTCAGGYVCNFVRSGESSVSGTGSNGPSSLPCSTPQARYTSMLLATTTRPARPWNVSINDSACMPELRIRSMTTSAFGRRVGKSRRSPRID